MLSKVLIVHNEYQLPGGEDQVVANELALLRSRGLDASVYRVTNHSIDGVGDKLRAALSATYSLQARRRFDAQLTALRPDIVHVHNFFPLISPSVYDACRDRGLPVIQTLHNYRILCPAAILARGGQVCEECVGRMPLPAILHCCYRRSLAGTLAVATMVGVHRIRNTWNHKVNRFIALTEFARDRFVRGGLEPDRIAIKPNFIEDPYEGQWRQRRGRRGRILFVGRLAPEKGISTLLDAWSTDMPELVIVGEGPLSELVRARSGGNIRYLGALPRDGVTAQMAAADYLIIPSEWYEGLPMTFVEAMAAGLPVLASRIGSLAELVIPDHNGFLFEAGNPTDISSVVRSATAPETTLEDLRQAARSEYISRYSPEVNFTRLLAIYKDAGVQRDSGMR